MWINGRYVVLQEEAAADGAAASGGQDGAAAAGTTAGAAADSAVTGTSGAAASSGDAQGTSQGADQGAAKDTGQDAGKDQGAKALWPDNWRDIYAKGDEKKLQHLSRYASPEAALDAMIAAQNKIRSGEVKSALPKNATEDQIKQWRSENGIPEAPDKYDLTFEDGLVVGDEDKVWVGEFLKAAHQTHQTPEQVKATLKWYYDFVDKRAEERDTKDRSRAQTTQDALRAEWGNEYRQNMNLMHGLLDTAPPGVKEKFLGGRLADGTPIGSDPDTLRFLTMLARQINPVTTLVPGAGVNISGAIDDEIAQLEGLMSNRSSEYWKGPTSEKKQARYRELISARERLGQRKAS